MSISDLDELTLYEYSQVKAAHAEHVAYQLKSQAWLIANFNKAKKLPNWKTLHEPAISNETAKDEWEEMQRIKEMRKCRSQKT